jgi:hypothetical protein
MPQALHAEGRSELLLAMEVVRTNVERLRARTVIMIGEVWTSPHGDGPVVAPRSDPYRGEALQLHALRSDGTSIVLAARIERSGEEIRLGETYEVESLGSPFFNPVRKAWEKLGFLAK